MQLQQLLSGAEGARASPAAADRAAPARQDRLGDGRPRRGGAAAAAVAALAVVGAAEREHPPVARERERVAVPADRADDVFAVELAHAADLGVDATRLANQWISAIIASPDKELADIVSRAQYKQLSAATITKAAVKTQAAAGADKQDENGARGDKVAGGRRQEEKYKVGENWKFNTNENNSNNDKSSGGKSETLDSVSGFYTDTLTDKNEFIQIS